jgi:hypothetical protein
MADMVTVDPDGVANVGIGNAARRVQNLLTICQGGPPRR